MKRTGVFATDEEKQEIIELHKAACKTPAILVGSMDIAGNAWERLIKRVHAVALAHGLPEIPGYYGFDGVNGEFVQA
jgi:hypothetical protein